VTVLIDAVREAAQQSDDERRLFLVPNAHVTQLHTTNGAVSSVDVFVDGVLRSLPVGPSCAVVLALGTIESTRLALVSFPTSANDPSRELMGRNLMAHIRINIFVRVRRSALDPGATLPRQLQTGALIVRGATAAGKFHLQITASADVGANADALLYEFDPRHRSARGDARKPAGRLDLARVPRRFTNDRRQGEQRPKHRWAMDQPEPVRE